MPDRSIRASRAIAPRSSGLTAARAPPCLPTGVRTAPTIQVSVKPLFNVGRLLHVRGAFMESYPLKLGRLNQFVLLPGHLYLGLRLTQLEALYLARNGLGEFVDELHQVRVLVALQPILAP